MIIWLNLMKWHLIYTQRGLVKKKLCLRYFKIKKHGINLLYSSKLVIRYEILAKCPQQTIERYIYVLETMVLFAVILQNNKCVE